MCGATHPSWETVEGGDSALDAVLLFPVCVCERALGKLCKQPALPKRQARGVSSNKEHTRQIGRAKQGRIKMNKGDFNKRDRSDSLDQVGPRPGYTGP